LGATVGIAARRTDPFSIRGQAAGITFFIADVCAAFATAFNVAGLLTSHAAACFAAAASGFA